MQFSCGKELTIFLRTISPTFHTSSFASSPITVLACGNINYYTYTLYRTQIMNTLSAAAAATRTRHFFVPSADKVQPEKTQIEVCEVNLISWVVHFCDLASFPGPRPASHRLQYGKAGEGLVHFLT